MKYSFNTWCYGSFPTWLPAYPIEVVVDRLAAIGYDAIEIGCAAPHCWPAYLSRERREALRRHVEGRGLVVSSVLPAPGGGPGCNVASCIGEERAWSIAHYKEVVQLGAQLGAGVVLYIGGWRAFGTSACEAKKWCADALYAVATEAGQHGLRVAVEPTPADSNVIESSEDALDLLEVVGLDNVGVMLDTFHVLYRNEVMSDYAHRMGRHLIHTHWADYGRAAPGDGGADFSGLAQALHDIDYQGFVCMEVGFNRRDVDPDALARRSLAYVKRVMGD
ncbi:MAG: sugar phosphate isomerase/epimerase [Actinomycetota bacterium]|nr:sugar phosphate isomerase/epimerase [Actinomycetota bacterium]